MSSVNRRIISVLLYSVLFVVIVLSLKKGYLKYQIGRVRAAPSRVGQIAWSMLTIVIVVFQIRAVVPMVMDGLIWFILSTTTVITNDTMAYFCGMLFGKKWKLSVGLTSRFIKKPLTPLSPNKSWEGFIGGGICTVIIGQIIVHSIQIPHLYCAFNHPNCPLPDYYQPHFYAFPEALANIIQIKGFSTCPIYLHELVFSVFASLRRLLRLRHQESVRQEGLQLDHSGTRRFDGSLRLPVHHALFYFHVL